MHSPVMGQDITSKAIVTMLTLAMARTERKQFERGQTAYLTSLPLWFQKALFI